MITAFVTAVIDLLSTAISRPEPPSTLFLLRSFLVNKVPLILTRLSPSPLIASFALSQAFLRGDVNPLINISPNTFESTSNSTSQSDVFGDISVDLRQEFLFACALHSIIAESDIQGILGELPLSALPLSGAYNPQDLISECVMDPSRVDRLLDELENTEGNSGAVCRALFAVMKNMCEQRETMPLRNICNFITRKPGRVDILLLFIPPSDIIDPLCNLLDTWRYEEDQGEYQPVYEEFGSILLLILTLHHRHSIPPPTNPSSFLTPLLSSSACRIETLSSSDAHAQLGGWVRELFDNEGISDSLMASCLPQHFYRLIPTLFAQTLLAMDRGVLDLETVKEAFTFLLSPFLLPSLIPGITHLTHHLWRCTHADGGDPAPALQLLHLLSTPSNTAELETQQTHSAILGLVAPTVYPVLLGLQHGALPHGLLARFVPQMPRHIATKDELDAWGNLARTLQNVLAEKDLSRLYLLPKMLYAGREVWGVEKVVETVCAVEGDMGENVDLVVAGLVGMGGEWWGGEGEKGAVRREVGRRGRDWEGVLRGVGERRLDGVLGMEGFLEMDGMDI